MPKPAMPKPAFKPAPAPSGSGLFSRIKSGLKPLGKLVKAAA